MKRYFVIAVTLALLIILGIIFFKRRTDIFVFFFPKKENKHALIRALPFKKKVKIRNKHKLLIEKLKSNQIYLENIIITPQNAPRGSYVSLSLVVEFKDKRIAKDMRERKAVLKNIIINKSNDWDYIDFQNMDGLSIIKKDILKTFKEHFKSKVEKIYLVEYKILHQKRL